MTDEEKRAQRNAYMREWTAKNREHVRKYKREYYARNPEFRAAQAKRIKAWTAANKERRTKWANDSRESIREKARAWAAANRDRKRQHHQNERKNNRAGLFITSIRKTAQRKGLAFDLTKDWINQRLKAGVCEMSGVPFDMEGKKTPLSPSVDRINPKGPYTQANCRLIIWFLNAALSNLGEDFALDVFRRVLDRRPPKGPSFDEWNRDNPMPLVKFFRG